MQSDETNSQAASYTPIDSAPSGSASHDSTPRASLPHEFVPKISVIVPLYNVAHVVQDTLDSLFQQTLDDVEYLLIDDGSTDNSASRVRDVIADNPAFQLLQQSNQGSFCRQKQRFAACTRPISVLSRRR